MAAEPSFRSRIDEVAVAEHLPSASQWEPTPISVQSDPTPIAEEMPLDAGGITPAAVSGDELEIPAFLRRRP